MVFLLEECALEIYANYHDKLDANIEESYLGIGFSTIRKECREMKITL
jgi:hypothetical protein